MRFPLFTHTIGAITVRAYTELDDDADTRDFAREVKRDIKRRGLIPFGTTVEVLKNGHVIGRSGLWGSFVDPTTGPADPYLLNVARVQIGPDAIEEARRTLA